MRIRDLDWRGETVWPPEWWPPERVAKIGKDDVLKEVLVQDIGRQYIQIQIETTNGPLWGVILLEYPIHIQILYEKLKENIGKPLIEIGYQEIDLFLSLQKRGVKQVQSSRTPCQMKRLSNKKCSKEG